MYKMITIYLLYFYYNIIINMLFVSLYQIYLYYITQCHIINIMIYLNMGHLLIIFYMGLNNHPLVLINIKEY